jgi:hypothetical protein
MKAMKKERYGKGREHKRQSFGNGKKGNKGKNKNKYHRKEMRNERCKHE